MSGMRNMRVKTFKCKLFFNLHSLRGVYIFTDLSLDSQMFRLFLNNFNIIWQTCSTHFWRLYSEEKVLILFSFGDIDKNDTKNVQKFFNQSRSCNFTSCSTCRSTYRLMILKSLQNRSIQNTMLFLNKCCNLWHHNVKMTSRHTATTNQQTSEIHSSRRILYVNVLISHASWMI